MNIIPDPILVVLQALPFLVLLAGLHVILYKPMLAYLAERREATAGAKKAAQELQERAALKLQQDRKSVV
jgi:F0F1-type ATP synthase membrane subunit b/b'